MPVDRFDVTSTLGEGGMGVVYAAWDRARGQRVALKTLRALDAASSVRFKQEFRIVRDLHHPNLVTLGELIETSGRLMFTMELVDGVDFQRYVRGLEDQRDSSDPITAWAIDARRNGRAAPELGYGRLDVARLRCVLPQLLAALAHLHAAGVVHRDVKPSNVLVTAEGRLVLLDFGVAGPSGVSPNLSGTPEYMAPELLDGRVGPAADVYAVGVLLYEALVGARPFEGPASKLLAQKAVRDPERPSRLRADVPEDLDVLCLALLARDPSMRPSARAALESLERASSSARASTPSRRAAIVGRGRELDALRAAHDSRARGPVIVTIEAGAGLGKSTLLEAFTAGLEGALVLSGRCREEEAIPFRAFDGVIDALSDALARDPALVRAVGADLDSAAAMFPALARAPFGGGADRSGVIELGEARRRAFGATRRLLGAIAAQRDLVVCIDDAQWADVDSAALLDAIVDAVDAPRALFVIAHRPVAPTHALATALHRLEGRVPRVHVAVEPLSDDASRALVASLAPTSTEAARARASASAGGHPLQLHEIAHVLHAGGEPSATLEDIFDARLAALDADARALLEIAAVAGYPIDRHVAARAAGVQDVSALPSLASARMIRRGGARGPDVIELAHDRLREHVVRHLSLEARQAAHTRLAEAIEALGIDDADHLAEHFAEAGLLERAGGPARVAAQRAERGLAFERAAWLHRVAASDPAIDEAARRTQHIRLGEALARAGRGRESADAFLAAGRTADEATWLSLRQRAAEELLITGHLDDGLAILRGVLEDVGLEATSSPWTALPSIAIESTRLALRGLDFEVKPEAAWPRKLRMRVDACLAAARALSIVDTITGAAFQLRALRLALDLGDPYRVLYTVALGAGFAAANEGARGTSADAHLVAAERTSALVQDPRGHAFVLMARGAVAYCRGEFEGVVLAMRESEHWLATRCTYATWELNIVRTFLALALAYRGDLVTLTRVLAEYEKDADARSDAYAAGHFRLATRPWLSLASGDIAEGREALRAALAAFEFEGYSWAAFHAHLHLALFALADGDVEAADEAIRKVDALPGPILLARFRLHRLLSRWVKGRVEVTRAAGQRDKAGIRKIRGIVSAIFEEGEPWADGLAHALDAAACRLDGDDVLATVALRAARDAFGRAGMSLFEAAATYELGALLGERDHGPSLVVLGERMLVERGVGAPARLAGLLAGIG